MSNTTAKPLTTANIRKKRSHLQETPFYVMLLPGVILTLIFSYFPMYGLVMAFQNYKPLLSFAGSKWVGLQNFQDMLRLPRFWSIVGNTLTISTWKIVLGLIVPLIIALQLNEVISNKFKRVAQTVFFLPYFLSWAVLGGILRNLFMYDGMINGILIRLGLEPVKFLMDNKWFPVILIVSDVWKGMGYNMIVFLAAITNVDPSLHESAALDGATRWQQTWHITLPTIRPIVVMMAVLSLGSVLSAGSEQILLLYNESVYESSDVIDTFVYRMGLVNHQWSLSAAVGMMKSVVSSILILFSHFIVNKFLDYQVF